VKIFLIAESWVSYRDVATEEEEQFWDRGSGGPLHSTQRCLGVMTPDGNYASKQAR
jgi:hypothetical protein